MKQLVESPKISVCIVVYNQEKYIAECLRSIINQSTNFEFEIIIGDDCSTDQTSDIIREFCGSSQLEITAIFHDENIGASANLISVYQNAVGKYIAHIDGDDCMEPGKLQRQFDILEGHPECRVCTHDMKIIDENSAKLGGSFQRHKGGVFTLMDLYKNMPFFAHSSKMFVNDISFIKILTKNSIDIEIHVEQARSGHIFHIDEKLGSYRRGVGITQIGGQVNPLIPSAVRRVYRSALGDVNFTSIDQQNIKRYFSKSILNFSYQSALIGNRNDCRLFAVESMHIKIISFVQPILFLASLLPFGLEYLARMRSNWHFAFEEGGKISDATD